MKTAIQKLATPVHSGDWHDPPAKWAVIGPGDERQSFATKKAALLYRKIRRKAASEHEASRVFACTP